MRSKNGTVWATSNLGLHKFDSASNAYPLVARVKLKEKNMSARMIAEDPAGNIWFIYDGALGVNSCYLFEPETSQLHPVIVHDLKSGTPLYRYFCTSMSRVAFGKIPGLAASTNSVAGKASRGNWFWSSVFSKIMTS
ncbi:MAG: hypothetical protein IPM82_16110 [Saprospiraceae bacterium]|nr:hypothetical protein [Saprospiraceae bacterium]